MAEGDSLRRTARDELVAAVEVGDALTANFFHAPHFGPYKLWGDKTAAFVETVFGRHERERLMRPLDSRSASYGDVLQARLSRLRDLLDREAQWELQV